MAENQAIERYRRWYRQLLRLYSRQHGERFAESMEQTFNDLCRERAGAGKGLGCFVLWMFVETLTRIIREKGRSVVIQHKSILRIVLATGCILLVPLLGNLFMGWSWPGFVLVFINAAAGIIGDGPVNLMYLGVLGVGFVGAGIARFQPRGMALALFATAVAQILVPVVAFVIWNAGWLDLLVEPNSPHPPFHPGVAPVFVLNGVFAALWVGSALLFRHAGNSGSGIPRQVRGAAPIENSA